MQLVSAERDALLKPIQTVSGIVERRHTLPILSNLLIRKTGSELTFLATDIEVQISTKAEGGAGADVATTVAARKLLDILRALPEGSEVQVAVQDKRLQLKSGKSRFNLQTLPAEDFPRMAPPEAGVVKLSLPQKVLKSLLALVQYSMAQQDIRYYLNGLLVVIEGGDFRVVATDGHRLALASKAVAPKDIDKQEVILPRKTIIELTRLLSDGDELVEIEVAPNQEKFLFGGVTLISKLIDGKFPDYNRVIPKGHSKLITLNRTVLQQSLQRAAILTNDKFRGVRWILTPGSLKISCSNTEQEEAQEELDVDYEGEALDIGFNVGYLLDVLNNLDVESVQCSLGDANSSGLITVPGRDDFKYVVMPMRI